MKLDRTTEQELNKKLKEVVGKHLDLTKYNLFYFGSRVTDKGSERSDIDVGIEGPKAVPFKVLAEIEEELEWLPTLYTIELVDFNSVSEDFKKVALQNTQKII